MKVQVLFFFFSSRRRHTRWTGDWSSDVCSSDLRGRRARGGWRRRRARRCRETTRRRRASPGGPRGRSEERRVGKECRSRWSPSHSKKKKEQREMKKNKYKEQQKK